jgi:thymidylate synthase (FAD)
LKVKLVQATPNPVKLITDVASICYGNDEAKYPERLFKHLYESGHHSTFEHVYFTFKIEGISRACLAQLTRHRHASYSVRSQRYCDESETQVVVPDSVKEDKELLDIYTYQTNGRSKEVYDYLILKGVKKEDARFVLPQALLTDLYMSVNLRELIHINKLRTSKQAQWEIRDLVNEMTMLVVENTPELAFMFKEEE